MLFILLGVLTAMLRIMVKLISIFSVTAKHLGITHLTKKRVKYFEASAISDQLLQCVCFINYDHFNL